MPGEIQAKKKTPTIPPERKTVGVVSGYLVAPALENKALAGDDAKVRTGQLFVQLSLLMDLTLRVEEEALVLARPLHASGEVSEQPVEGVGVAPMESVTDWACGSRDVVTWDRQRHPRRTLDTLAQYRPCLWKFGV